MSRRNARENAFKILFSVITEKKDGIPQIFFDEIKDSEIWTGKSLSDEDKAYIEGVCRGVVEKEEELDEIIKKYLKEWDIERINRVCLAALRLAVYEILYVEEVPLKVSASEVVEIVKKYADEKDSKFCNGILGEYIRNEHNK